MLSFLIVGSGYRAAFFGRVAKTYPALFRALFLCRSEEKVRKMKEETGIDGTVSLSEALAFSPDFVVAAVNKTSIAAVTEKWVSRGFAVLTETPLGASREDLDRLTTLYEQGARIVTCEQYHRYPSLVQGLRAVREGCIGTPFTAYLSLAHDYHGFSLMKRLLLTQGESYTLQAWSITTPLVETSSREGDLFTGNRVPEERNLALVTFSSGKKAIYDFSGRQYHSHIRFRHLSVRGERGEWSDRLLTLVPEGEDGGWKPVRIPVLPEISGRHRLLETEELRDRIRRESEGIKANGNQSFLTMENWEDELAIGSILLDMEEYLKGGEEPYPFYEAREDALFWLRLQEALHAV